MLFYRSHCNIQYFYYQEYNETEEEPEGEGSESLFSNEDSRDESWIPSIEKGHASNSKRAAKRSPKTAMELKKKIQLSEESDSNKTENQEGQPVESVQKDQEAAYERRKISCPLFSRRAKVVHVPRHMRARFTTGPKRQLPKYSLSSTLENVSL